MDVRHYKKNSFLDWVPYPVYFVRSRAVFSSSLLREVCCCAMTAGIHCPAYLPACLPVRKPDKRFPLSISLGISAGGVVVLERE